MSDTRESIDHLAADPLDQPRFSSIELVASLLAVVWVVAVLGYRFTASEGTSALGWVVTLLAVALPLALIWAAASTLRSVSLLRAEAAELQATVNAMRSAFGDTQQAGAAYPTAAARQSTGNLPQLQPQPLRQPRNDAAGFAPRRDTALGGAPVDRRAAVPPASALEDEPGLALGTPPEALRLPVSAHDLIRALQFPENPDDADGFRSLRAALEDREVAKLIRAAQDVLTLLSQESIYMDDLAPDRARPEVWRRFAAGDRGRGIASIGGVRDRNALALTAGRMREDPVFRDAGHHFLRTFDRSFQAFEKNASDADISDLSDTRTARAFMLFGRVMGVFD
jgi:hypothetical protein